MELGKNLSKIVRHDLTVVALAGLTLFGAYSLDKYLGPLSLDNMLNWVGLI